MSHMGSCVHGQSFTRVCTRGVGTLLLSHTHTHAHTLPPRTSRADWWTCDQDVRGLAGLLLLERRFIETRQEPWKCH